ncbi:hypothetical protein [Mesorhizobium carmichaelinearum]|nr:hypothetical protein [Mesorhizobium carmichaelinearum]
MQDTAKPLLRAWSGTTLLLSVVDVQERPFAPVAPSAFGTAS